MPTYRRPRDASDRADSLLREFATLSEGPSKAAFRESLITSLLPLARRLAHRYQGMGDLREDLEQVAGLGLVRAVDRYDPTRGHSFLSYAVPTITGEIKRHLRDSTWDVHVPRAVQDALRRFRIAQAADPGATTPELAEAAGLDVDQMRQIRAARHAYCARSLDAAASDDDGRRLVDRMGTEDPRYDMVVDLLAVRHAAARLPERERRILDLYFFQGITQQQVAAALGLSQMHICRLLRRACAFLRGELLGHQPASTPAE